MRRPWHIATAFGASLVLLLAATAWMSWTTLRLNRAEAETRAQASLEETIRLALWRIDSALAPLMSQERARPYFVYSAFYPAEAAYTRMFADLEIGSVLIPSPLLAPPTPYVLLHFQFDEAGEASSPQVPTGRLRELATPGYVSPNQISVAEERLADLRSAVSRETLLALLPRPEDAAQPVVVGVSTRAFAQRPAPPQPVAQQSQMQRNSAEYQARSQQFQQQTVSPAGKNAFVRTGEGVREGVFEPRWVAGRLLLARRVEVNGEEYVQGLWLDWDALRTWLLESVTDLLPGAGLQPARDDGDAGLHQRRLAGLPVRLEAPAADVAAALDPTQVWWPLVVAWGCVALATAAVGVLLAGTVALSERRAAFVSAVSHEMRTPLTTFRLYSEMLATGMITEEATRGRYLQTLSEEALRLTHLVENVLAYARLENRRAPAPQARIAIAELLQRVEERLQERARQANMQLVIDAAEAGECIVCADGAAVEQILFNLVDNACKYAAAATDRQMHLGVAVGGEWVKLRVRDQGPGISRRVGRRLFTPFHKSAGEAADTAPGVGLGLALSRRLARAMGGDLRLEPTKVGASFALRVRRARG